MADDTDAQRPRRAIRLSKVMRAVSGLVGAGSAGAGGYAVFVTDNQAGTTALLLLGGVGLLMGLTGRVPERIGREGLVHEPVESEPAVETVRKLTTEETPAAVRDAVATEFVRQVGVGRDDTASQSSERTGYLLSTHDSAAPTLTQTALSVVFEQRARAIVGHAVQSLLAREATSKIFVGVDLLPGRTSRASPRVDYLISPRTQWTAERAVAIEIVSRRQTRNLSNIIAALLQEQGFEQVVMIVPNSTLPSYIDTARDSLTPAEKQRIHVLFLRETGDTTTDEIDLVSGAIERALSRLPGSVAQE